MFNALVYLAILFLPISLAIGNVAIDSTAVLLDVLFLADVFRRRDFSIFKERWFIAASAFWCYIVLSSYLSIDPKLALKGALPFIRFPLLGLAIFYFLRKDHRILKPLFTISACVVAVLSLNALVQLATGYDLFGHEKLQYAHFWRLTTPYGKQRVGYTCLFLCVPLLGYMFDCIKNKTMSIRASVVMCMVILCGFATLLLSGERMPLAVLGIAVLFAIISLPQLRIKGGIAVCLMTFLLGVTILGVPALKSRIIDFSLAQLSKPRDDAYGQIYVASIDMFKHNFWFGVGSKHFSHACQQLDHGESETFACACHPHNWYLQVLAENGIIGALLFATMVLALMWRVLRFRGAYYAYFSAALLFAKLLPFIPASSLYSTFSLTPLWLIVGIALLPPLKSGVAATPLPMP